MPLAFFTEFTFFKGVLYSVCAIYVISTAIAVMFEPFMTLPCELNDIDTASALSLTNTTFPNVFYTNNPCQTTTRYLRLMGLTIQECTFGRNLVVAVILGSLIGYERRSADRPAGIRTTSLVSLAACLFTLNSTFVFMDGPMHWDPARVSAAIPSGVGFLGAGLIVKDIYKDIDGESTHTVKGLNTAASVWLSAAVGVACGGGLYFVATYTSALLLVLLRFGPRTMVRTDSNSNVGSISILPDHRPSPSRRRSAGYN
mmetsp:Transcript_7903/g.17798  ORF Transcript_7903/g.17798 Transcript_7903/m.17798 type:complete len:257 (-) Transcript_7903:403-1173(-)|eukprot:CAMPEP_0172308550 /NCGR_PEP_ID=MMETSP1058-20130122/9107_1 /TAXON_ID=83371 /ORGANISM="Detonula confervacea, Strain CCMP 353" /LENGTH=256 /DNA_ID=CAMNT_0013020989 /DNA_START=64 /DNA_END=834 /DNA_ORIENTATION=+